MDEVGTGLFLSLITYHLSLLRMAKAKHISGIECDAPAANGIQLVLTGRLKEMCAFRKKALDWSDPEGVHDMRVASRRLRSALRDFSPYLRKRQMKASLDEIKKIADTLGEVRDEDVAILALEKVMQKTPAQFRDGIEELIELRRAKLKQSRKALMQILRHRTIVKVQTDFASALSDALKPQTRKSRPDAGLANAVSYRQVARGTILSRLNEVEQLSNSLYHPLKATPLHKMRIAAKRLRYALELFDECWAPRLKPFAKKVATLQTALGELHDCDVWIVDFGDRLAAGNKTSLEKNVTRNEAWLWLLAHFVRMRTRYFQEALMRWREWETKDSSQELCSIVDVGTAVTVVTTGEASIATTETHGTGEISAADHAGII